MTPEVIQQLREKGVPARLAKSVNMTHSLARMGMLDLDSVMKAMDTQTAGEGKDWINTGFSPEMIRSVTLDRKVSPLFRRFKMPTNPYKFPVLGGPPKACLIPENIADTVQTGIPVSNVGSTSLTFDARKLARKVIFSEELSQDSMIGIEEIVQEGLLGALVTGEEDATINGDVSTTHMDADIVSALDPRKAWKGLRKTAKDALGEVDLSTLSLANL